jgi:hypothetical protein
MLPVREVQHGWLADVLEHWLVLEHPVGVRTHVAC